MVIKKNALDQLFNIQQSKFKGALTFWKEKVRAMQVQELMDNQKKKEIISKITKIVESSSDQTIKKSIKKFYLNFKIEKVQKRFIQKLLQTKSGKVIEAFNKWK